MRNVLIAVVLFYVIIGGACWVFSRGEGRKDGK